ncbi:MAG: formylglycine-generating enzyme family protein [Gammaproteobacteria bacterium]|nr:formylglycine-generating enzyme family protein [Gammaproteobacteria bacterium]
MSSPLRGLIDTLRDDLGLNPDAEEIADLLWLAAHLEKNRAFSAARASAPEKFFNKPDKPAARPANEARTKQKQKTPIYADSGQTEQTAADATEAELAEEPGGAQRFRVHGSVMLQDALGLGRALRPLMRKTPSRTRLVLDEAASVERIAEQRMWLPVFKGAPERRFDLALLIERSPSMRLWYPLLDELRELLTHHGAFRDVRVWSLEAVERKNPGSVVLQCDSSSQSPGSVALQCDSSSHTGVWSSREASHTGVWPSREASHTGVWPSREASHTGVWPSREAKQKTPLHPCFWRGLYGSRSAFPEELLDEQGRRIIWLLSDCAGRAWHEGIYDDWLRLWGRCHPLLLLNLLPPRLWPRSGLRRCEKVLLRAAAPGLPNAKLQILPPGPAGDTPLPTAALQAEFIRDWTRLLAGNGAALHSGFVLSRPASAPPRGVSRPDLTPAQRLDYFQRNASVQTQALTRHCAAIPLTLPIIRLLQDLLLRDTAQVHLAEFFLSGLLLRKNPQQTRADKFFYDFYPGLRERLLEELDSGQIVNIHLRLSEAVEQGHGGRDFMALLPDLLRAGGPVLDADSVHFAEVGVTVLKRLGYAVQAEELEKKVWRLKNPSPMEDTEEFAARSPGHDEKTEADPALPDFTPFRDSLKSGGEGPEMVSLENTPLKLKMGSEEYDDEKPVHEVILSPFSVGKYPVTVGEYLKFVEHNKNQTDLKDLSGLRVPEWMEEGSQYNIKTGSDGHYKKLGDSLTNPDCPIVGIFWEDSQAYCQWLSEETNTQYRLLTEAEWEYACRAGSEGAWCFGDDEKQLGDYAWYDKNSDNKTHPVGKRTPGMFH